MIYVVCTATLISLVVTYSLSLLSVSCHATISLLFTMCPLLHSIKVPCTLSKCILLSPNLYMVSAFKNFTIYSKRIGKNVITMNHVKMMPCYFDKKQMCESEINVRVK